MLGNTCVTNGPRVYGPIWNTPGLALLVLTGRNCRLIADESVEGLKIVTSVCHEVPLRPLVFALSTVITAVGPHSVPVTLTGSLTVTAPCG